MDYSSPGLLISEAYTVTILIFVRCFLFAVVLLLFLLFCFRFVFSLIYLPLFLWGVWGGLFCFCLFGSFLFCCALFFVCLFFGGGGCGVGCRVPRLVSLVLSSGFSFSRLWAL